MSINGQLQQIDFFDNTGGLNISDSPFAVEDGQATGGVNYDYVQTGGIRKRFGSQALNTTADTELRSNGLAIYETKTSAKTPIRSAGRRIQAVTLTPFSTTNLSQDTTAASTTPFPSGNTTPTVFSQFNTTANDILFFAGNTDDVLGVYSTSKWTRNGIAEPAGSLTMALTTGGSFNTSGSFYYAVALQKASTGITSNAVLDAVAVLTTTSNAVRVTVNITTMDTTLYSRILLYRSAVSGVTDFTTGDLVASTTAASSVMFTDTGSSLESVISIPRADAAVDHSPLPSGTYDLVTTWKRRLVTIQNNTVYFSELNQPEYWPTTNTITLPKGGKITALGIISFNTDFGNDEYLAVFQDRSLWLIKGNDSDDITLSFIDAVGCPAQNLVVTANGYLFWLDYRGIYLWNGSGKPIYTSRPIESAFNLDGDLDKTKLSEGWGTFFRRANQVIWFLSSKLYGEQMFAVKLDLRLTLPGVNDTLFGRILDGKFTFDSFAQAYFSGISYLPTSGNQEQLLIGDNAGFLYDAYNLYSDGSAAIDFNYITKFIDCGNPNISKRFLKVIVWVEELGTWDLTLDYWAGYRANLNDKSTLALPISSAQQQPSAIWDLAAWDIANWDDFTLKSRPLVFNLNSEVKNNNEGDCIRLNFRQEDTDSPVTINGFSVIWQPKGLSK